MPLLDEIKLGKRRQPFMLSSKGFPQKHSHSPRLLFKIRCVLRRGGGEGLEISVEAES